MRDFNLFPSAENLFVLERKYGDSLSFFDLYGVKPKKKRKAKQDGEAGGLGDDKTAESKSQTRTLYS